MKEETNIRDEDLKELELNSEEEMEEVRFKRRHDDGIRFTLKDFGILFSILLTILGLWVSFTTRIDQTASELRIQVAVVQTRVDNLERNFQKLDDKLDKIQEMLNQLLHK